MGFRDVWRGASGVPLPGLGTIRIPTIAGFTLLKLSAWASRSSTGDYKDAGDLACAIFWYQQLDEVEYRLFQHERGARLLERTQFDAGVASVMLLIDDACSLLEEQRRSALKDLWNPTGDHEDLLATYLVNDRLPGWPTDPQRLLKYADAVRTTLLTTPGAVT